MNYFDILGAIGATAGVAILVALAIFLVGCLWLFIEDNFL